MGLITIGNGSPDLKFAANLFQMLWRGRHRRSAQLISPATASIVRMKDSLGGNSDRPA